ncbi:hypothetical protein [Vibrio alginolyticus]|uniref:hypothetical protein n=1 Tax=Vibrio harveyi group TaxID=717610 RepID=UPI003D7C3FA2
MKAKGVLVSVVVGFLIFPHESEAKRGFGSIFKVGKGARAVGGVKNYDFNTLTVGQLRQCLILESDIESSEQRLNTVREPLNSKEKVLNSLEAKVSSLDNYLTLNQNAVFYTQAEVDAFNNTVEKYNKLISTYNVELEHYRKLEAPYNGLVGEHNNKVNKFKMDCAGKRYYEEDLAAIKSGEK